MIGTSFSSPGRILPAIGKLIRLRLLISFNGFKHAKTIKKILTIVAGIGLLVFAGLILFLSVLLLNFLNSPQLKQYAGLDITPFLHVVPVLIFAGLFLGILFTSFGVLLQSLYLAGDMDFLLSSPVPIRAVFVSKMLQAVLPNFGLIVLFGLPVLFGMGISGHYNVLYYPFVLVVMIAIALAAAGISGLLVMLVVRVLPPRRAAEILGFLGAILAFTCGQSGNLFNAMNGKANLSGHQVNSLFTVLIRSNTAWFPLNWAGQGLVALGESHWFPGIALLALTLGGCAFAFFFALVTAERWYYTGWAGMQVIANKRKPIRTTIHPAGNTITFTGISHLIPAPIRGIIWKDFRLMRRDLRNLSQLISPIIFGVIYSFMFLSPGSQFSGGLGEMPGWFAGVVGILLTYGNVGMSLFVGWWLLARLAGMAFSAEGKNYWMIKSAPVRASQLLTAKFLVAYLPTVGLSGLFLAGITLLQKTSQTNFAYNLMAVLMCLAGMTGIQLAFGVAGANFTWDDPRKMGAGGLGCLGQFLMSLMMPVLFSLFVGPLLLIPLLKLPIIDGYLLGTIAGCSLSLGCAILPPWLVRNRVNRLAEQ
jgi:ABC-2 type transport system permease protein